MHFAYFCLAAVSGIAVGLAGPASAQELAGTYDYVVTGSQTFSAIGPERWPDPDADTRWPWRLTSCGNACSTVISETGGWSQQMQMLDGRWQFTRPSAGATCDGIPIPSTFEYSFDPVTLTGTLRDAGTCHGLRAYSETPVSLVRTD